MKNKIKDLLQLIYILKYTYYLKKINKLKKKSDNLLKKVSLGNLFNLANKYGDLL